MRLNWVEKLKGKVVESAGLAADFKRVDPVVYLKFLVHECKSSFSVSNRRPLA